MLNNFKVLLGLSIVIAGIAYYVTQSGDGVADMPKHLMPDWQDNAQAVANIDKVVLSKGEETIELVKNEASWYVNNGFFAHLSPLSELFQSLKSAEFVEAKTQNPENFAQLELAEDDLKISFYQADQLLDAIHVGKKTSAGQVFVRRAGENQTYTVRDLTPPTFNENSWLLTTVVDIAAEDVFKVNFAPTEGEAFAIERDPENLSLQVVDMPETHQLKAVNQMGSLVGGLTRLMIDEAVPVDLTDKVEVTTISYELSDGSEVVLKLYQQDEEHFLTIDGDKMSRFKPWMMQIATYKFDALNKKLDDVVEPKPAAQSDSEEAVEQAEPIE